MQLILGGAYQGKLDYVLATHHLTQQDVADGCLDESKRIIYNLQDYIFQSLQQKEQPFKQLEVFLQSVAEDTIFICNEVGNGIIPIDPLERQYRDLVGKSCCLLAERADKVCRMVCGIPQVIKDA